MKKKGKKKEKEREKERKGREREEGRGVEEARKGKWAVREKGKMKVGREASVRSAAVRVGQNTHITLDYYQIIDVLVFFICL